MKNKLVIISLLINYSNDEKTIMKWRQKYFGINISSLNGLSYKDMTFISYKFLTARKENKYYVLIYTPDERADICDILHQVDARIRNLVNTIEIE